MNPIGETKNRLAGITTGGRPAARRLFRALAASVVVGTGLVGCGSDLKVAPEQYRGPELSKDTLDDSHVVVAQAPSPGWQIEIDATRKSADGSDVYVTLRRPNPTGVYPQVIVEQRMLTRVRKDEPLGILARVMDYGAEDEGAYRRVR